MIKVLKEAFPWLVFGALLPIGALSIFFGILFVLS